MPSPKLRQSRRTRLAVDGISARLSGVWARSSPEAVKRGVGDAGLEVRHPLAWRYRVHPLGVAHRRQRPGDHQAIVARQHPGNPLGIVNAWVMPPSRQIVGKGYTRFIGSGSAGLGKSLNTGFVQSATSASSPTRTALSNSLQSAHCSMSRNPKFVQSRRTIARAMSC